MGRWRDKDRTTESGFILRPSWIVHKNLQIINRRVQRIIVFSFISDVRWTEKFIKKLRFLSTQPAEQLLSKVCTSVFAWLGTDRQQGSRAYAFDLQIIGMIALRELRVSRQLSFERFYALLGLWDSGSEGIAGDGRRDGCKMTNPARCAVRRATFDSVNSLKWFHSSSAHGGACLNLPWLRLSVRELSADYPNRCEHNTSPKTRAGEPPLVNGTIRDLLELTGLYWRAVT